MSRVLLKDDVTLCREDGSSVKFHIKAHIGSGASCVVYHAFCDDNTEHLLKEYYPLNLELERNGDGALIVPKHKRDLFDKGLERFRNSNERQKEVRFLEYQKNSTANVQGYFYGNGTEYIDMTVFSGQTYNHIESETLHSLMLRMRELAQAIGNYHSAGFLHLDIKPENIFVLDEKQSVKGIMLFDFDSVIEKSDKMILPTLSYTKDWAAPEQLLPYKRNSICEATDLFSIGEIIFTKIFGRHSTQSERRSFTEYDIDYNADVFKNVNPKVVPLIKELFRHTLCAVPARRYQMAGELIEQLDKIIELANSEKQFLISSTINPKSGFIGRDAEIKEIHARLQQNPILFLHGIGGIGKSELARQYASRYQSEYDTVFFAPYDTDIVFLIANDSSIQINNFSRTDNESLEKYYERKLQKLKELISGNGERILLIIDNLDTREDKNVKILFELGCSVLVTSRIDMGATFKRPQMEIEAFSDITIARELFGQHYHFSDDESSDVDAIINLVQGHTLAIELIAKQIDAEWSTVQEIRNKLESGGLSSIGDEDIDSVKDDDLSQKSAFGHIKALFDLSVFKKEHKYNDELYVLANLSLMPFTGINREWFANWCDLDNHGGKSCIRRLIQSGWVYDDGQNISVHSLVATVCLTSRNDDSIFDTFVGNISKQIAIEKVCDSAEISTYPPIFTNIFSRIKQCGINSEIIFSFLWNAQRWLNDNTAMKSAVESIVEYVITHDRKQSPDFYRRRIGFFISMLKYSIACFGEENHREAKLKYWQDVYKNLPVAFCVESVYENTDPQKRFEELSNQVTYFQDVGDQESEFALYEKIISTYESTPAFELDRLSKQEGAFEDIFYDIATAYEKLEQYDRAIAIYKKSLDAIPTDSDAKHLWDKERVYQSLLSCLTSSENWASLNDVSHQYFEWATKNYPRNHPKFLCAIEYLLVAQASPLMLCFSNENDFDGFFTGMYEACLEIERTFQMLCKTSEKIISYSLPSYLIEILSGVAHMICGYALLFLERTADNYDGDDEPPMDMDNQKALHLLLFVKLLFETIENRDEIDAVNDFIEYANLLLEE